MCTYQTTLVELRGSAKGRDGWFRASEASVYIDHPVHAPATHTLNVDVRNPAMGAGARVALELDAVSARHLAVAILRALDDAAPGLFDAPG